MSYTDVKILLDEEMRLLSMMMMLSVKSRTNLVLASNSNLAKINIVLNPLCPRCIFAREPG